MTTIEKRPPMHPAHAILAFALLVSPAQAGGLTGGRRSKALPISRFRLHSLQKSKRVERTNGDQFEAHHLRFTQRQLFEHFVSDRRIGDVDDESHALLSL